MGFAASTLWWIVAGVLVAVELGTSTFYLLMLALGAVAGALAAHGGLATAAQVVVAALIGGGGTAALYWQRSKAPAGPAPEANRDLQIDIGQPVSVASWSDDHTARVNYRGASWQVRFAGSGAPMPGTHVIVAVEGNQLQVAPAGH